MTIEVGIRPAVGEAHPDRAHPWTRRRAGDLQPGWQLLLDDGRSVTVLDLPWATRLGKVVVPVWTAAHQLDASLPPEDVLLPAMRLVPTRTAQEEAEYVEAVFAAAGREGN